MTKPSTYPWTLACLAGLTSLLAGCQTPPPAPPTSPEVVGEFRKGSGYLNGYLDRKQLPDSLALLPPPPAPGSAAQAADQDAYKSTRALLAGPRGALATKDANLKVPAAASTFECSLGIAISQEGTPNLNMLLRRTLLDAALSTYKAKDHYNRTRPFVVNNEHTCTPGDEAFLSKDGSYPSGHTAIGWAWALVLTQAAPQNMDAVLQRGYAFGQSRVICGAHWQSDVNAGRVMGGAAVARLQTDETFKAQLALARDEIAQAQAKGSKPTVDCAAEAAALAIR